MVKDTGAKVSYESYYIPIMFAGGLRVKCDVMF